MAENKLEIILEAVDNATKDIKNVQEQLKGINKEGEKTSNDSEKHTKKMVTQWAKVGLAIFGIANVLRALSREIQSVIKISAYWDTEFKKSLDDFQISINRLKLAIGEGLKPVIKETIEFWTNAIEKTLGGNERLTASQRQLINALQDTTKQQNLNNKQLFEYVWDNERVALNSAEMIAERRAQLERQRLVLIQQLHAIELESIEIKSSRVEQMLAMSLSKMMEMELQKEQDKIAQLSLIWNMYQQERTRTFMQEQQTQTEQYMFLIENQKMAQRSLWTTAGALRDTFSSGISKMFMDMTKGTLNAKQAFAQLGESMLQILIEFMVQKAVSFALSKVMLAGEVAAATAAGTGVAAAWSSAAAMVSLATLGTNAIPASAGITSTVALAKALSLPGLAEGGVVNKPTIAMIGEAGPEAVIPLSGKNRMGQYINIEINYPSFRSDEDIDKLTEEISLRLSHEAERI